ncbi:MAG: TolC family outer membrane protein [Burkholderiales bacterium]
MRRSLFQFVALLALAASALPAFPAETLRQAIAAALTRFPEIQAARYRQDATRAQLGQAQAELLPTISGSFGEGREKSRNVSTLVNRFKGDVTLTRQEAEISLSQLLFDGGAAQGQVKRFAARVEGAGFDVIGTAEEVALRTGQTFVEVGRLREQLAIARDNIGVHEKTLSDVNALADAGRGRRADVTQAEARRALASSTAEQLAGQLAQAEASFRHLTGRPPGELATPPSLQPELPVQPVAAVTQALAVHPNVKGAEKAVEAAQHDRESARARLTTPRVTVEAGASRNRDLDGVAGPNHDQYAMLRLRYNFFRGFGESERVRETEARIDEALATLARVRIDVERDVRQSWEALASERARLPQLDDYARASADVAEAYRLQFQLGQRSLLDVLNAENERYNAASAYMAARASVAANELRLLASQGRLVEVLDLRLPPIPGNEGRGAPVSTPAFTAASSQCDPAQNRCVAAYAKTESPDPTALDAPPENPWR